MDLLKNPAKYRKLWIALVAAGVTAAQTFGVPVAEGLSDQLVAAYDVLSAIAVGVVPNAE